MLCGIPADFACNRLERCPATGYTASPYVFRLRQFEALTYSASIDLKYSNLAAAPASFAACTYVPSVTNAYDPAIRHICVNPKGALAAGSPAPGYTLQFRARIK